MLNQFSIEEQESLKEMLNRAYVPDSSELSYSFDSDTLSYIDDLCTDTAFGEGAEIVANKYLTENEIEILISKGFFIKDKMIFAFSRYLMYQFILGSALVESHDREIKSILSTIKSIAGHEDINHEQAKLT